MAYWARGRTRYARQVFAAAMSCSLLLHAFLIALLPLPANLDVERVAALYGICHHEEEQPSSPLQHEEHGLLSCCLSHGSGLNYADLAPPPSAAYLNPLIADVRVSFAPREQVFVPSQPALASRPRAPPTLV